MGAPSMTLLPVEQDTLLASKELQFSKGEKILPQIANPDFGIS